jgi:outer membrane protein assembly factor BamB
VIINGVVFVLSSGELRSNDARLGAAERIRRSSPAVLYALDAISGQELWNSGNTMTSFVHSGGLSAGGGRIYVSTHDAVQYSFGFPIEH